MNHGVMFEAIPCSRNLSEVSAQRSVDRLADAVAGMKHVTAINIPEIADENHLGVPFYRNVDARQFGLLLRERCKKDIIVNTVVAHHGSKDKFELWLAESARKYLIKNFVFVGGKINSMRYPGPSVPESNLIARKLKLNFGNICIPERVNEVDRLLGKTASGCGFFTTQLLFEPEKIINILNEYSLRCEKSSLKPAKFFLSFTPLSSASDIEFIRWLGAEMRHKTERKLRNSRDIGEESVKAVADCYRSILDFIERTKTNIQLGLNIEHIMLHNLELSKNLANALADLKMELKASC